MIGKKNILKVQDAVLGLLEKKKEKIEEMDVYLLLGHEHQLGFDVHDVRTVSWKRRSVQMNFICDRLEK